MENSDPQGEVEGERRDLGDLWREIWAEIRAFRKYFSWNACIESVLLKLFKQTCTGFIIMNKVISLRDQPKVIHRLKECQYITRYSLLF